MTNKEIWQIAYAQSALDCNCAPEDFRKHEHVITRSIMHARARKYLPLPFACDLVSYGSNVVAQCSPELEEVVRAYLEKYPLEHAFETPHIHALDRLLEPYGLKVCFMAEYFLPDVNALEEQLCAYRLKLLEPSDFRELYLPQWSNALCEKRKELDVLAVGAYDGDKLVALAGCSADCENMYQIGVDVLEEYRGRGLSTAVTARLAREVLNRGKVPFYCAAWCNIKSVRNALRCGFRPAWVELTARDISFVEEMNQ